MPISSISKIQDRINSYHPSFVWSPQDFNDLASNEAIKKSLQRLVKAKRLMRIHRGLYTIPHVNPLNNKPVKPDYQQIIRTIMRLHQGRMLIDGMTAANALGLTNAVPSQVIIHTDLRLTPITIDNLTIQFKLTAPSKLYWASKSAMIIIQALYWLRDCIDSLSTDEKNSIQTKLNKIIHHSHDSKSIIDDFQQGINTVPQWMQSWIKVLLDNDESTIIGE